MSLAFVGTDLLSQTLTMTEAVDALERTFAATLPTSPARAHLETGAGDLLLMPAWGDDAAGVKLVTVAPGNPARNLPLIQGVYVLFEKPSLTPVALFDAAALTAVSDGRGLWGRHQTPGSGGGVLPGDLRGRRPGTLASRGDDGGAGDREGGHRLPHA